MKYVLVPMISDPSHWPLNTELPGDEIWQDKETLLSVFVPGDLVFKAGLVS